MQTEPRLCRLYAMGMFQCTASQLEDGLDNQGSATMDTLLLPQWQGTDVMKWTPRISADFWTHAQWHSRAQIKVWRTLLHYPIRFSINDHWLFSVKTTASRNSSRVIRRDRIFDLIKDRFILSVGWDVIPDEMAPLQHGIIWRSNLYMWTIASAKSCGKCKPLPIVVVTWPRMCDAESEEYLIMLFRCGGFRSLIAYHLRKFPQDLRVYTTIRLSSMVVQQPPWPLPKQFPEEPTLKVYNSLTRTKVSIALR